jgi:hypothetical protein
MSENSPNLVTLSGNAISRNAARFRFCLQSFFRFCLQSFFLFLWNK